MRPTWGPPGDDRTQVGPMLAAWTLLSGKPSWTVHVAVLTHRGWVPHIYNHFETKKMNLKMFAKWQPFCLSLNMLKACSSRPSSVFIHLFQAFSMSTIFISACFMFSYLSWKTLWLAALHYIVEYITSCGDCQTKPETAARHLTWYHTTRKANQDLRLHHYVIFSLGRLWFQNGWPIKVSVLPGFTADQADHIVITWHYRTFRWIGGLIQWTFPVSTYYFPQKVPTKGIAYLTCEGQICGAFCALKIWPPKFI